MRRFLRALFFTAGFIFLGVSGYFLWERFSPKPLIAAAAASESHIPASISFPGLGINLSIFPGNYSGGKWDVTNKGVSYLSSSPLPGEIGKSIFYGHNWPSILGKLEKAEVGQIFSIAFSDGEVKTFQITEKVVIDPSDFNILEQTSFPQVTVYTCTGFLDSKRLVVSAVPF